MIVKMRSSPLEAYMLTIKNWIAWMIEHSFVIILSEQQASYKQYWPMAIID